MTDSKFLKKLLGPKELVTDPYDQQSMYEEIASSTGLSPEDIAGIAGVESEFGKYDKPLSGGSARGTFQMMPTTSKYLAERSPEPRETNPLREQARLMKELIPQHIQEIQNALGEDTEITPEQIYIKHNLGAGMGKKLLKAKDKTPIEEIISGKVIEANPSIYKGKNKSEVLKEIQKRLNTKSKEFKFEDRSPLGFLEE